MNLPVTVLQVGSATETVYVNEALTVAGRQVATEGYVGIFGEQSIQDTPSISDPIQEHSFRIRCLDSVRCAR